MAAAEHDLGSSADHRPYRWRCWRARALFVAAWRRRRSLIVRSGSNRSASAARPISASSRARICVGDILPPPEYVIEPYLEANLIYNGEGKLAEHKARLTELRKDIRRAARLLAAKPVAGRNPAARSSRLRRRGGRDMARNRRRASFPPPPRRSREARGLLHAAQPALWRPPRGHRRRGDQGERLRRGDRSGGRKLRRAWRVGRSTACAALIILGLGGAFLALRRGVARPVAEVADKLAILAGRTTIRR